MKLRMETYGEADGAYDDDGGTKKTRIHNLIVLLKKEIMK